MIAPDVLAAAMTLFLIMDPLGNIPPFLAILKDVPKERKQKVLIREMLFALIILCGFLFLGQYILAAFQLKPSAISVGGGIVLFLIALKMIFPPEKGIMGEQMEGEPFIVPLAIPLIAGPSTLAALLLMERSAPERIMEWFLAVLIAWGASTLILIASPILYKILKKRGLIALERLMGMILVILSVQMFLTGVAEFLKL